MLFNFLIRISEYPPRADKSTIIRINLSDLTMSPLRFARGQALSAAKGLARGAARSFAALRMTMVEQRDDRAVLLAAL